MPGIKIIDSGHISRDDAAFPTLVRLDNGGDRLRVAE